MQNQQVEDKRKLLLEFINLYHQYPVLWKIKSKDYTDRKKKMQAYEVLLVKYKQIEPDADRETVKKKINSLRTNFRKELKKVYDSEVKGEYYEPTLWYYDNLLFLTKQEQSMDDVSTTTVKSEMIIEESDLQVDEEIPESVSINPQQNYSNDEYRYEPITSTKPVKRKSVNENYSQPQSTNNGVKLNSETIQQRSVKRNSISFNEDDEFDYLANLWSIELKKMKFDQQLFARKAINDILFEGQLGTLHRNSVQINKSTSSDVNSLRTYI